MVMIRIIIKIIIIIQLNLNNLGTVGSRKSAQIIKMVALGDSDFIHAYIIKSTK